MIIISLETRVLSEILLRKALASESLNILLGVWPGRSLPPAIFRIGRSIRTGAICMYTISVCCCHFCTEASSLASYICLQHADIKLSMYSICMLAKTSFCLKTQLALPRNRVGKQKKGQKNKILLLEGSILFNVEYAASVTSCVSN